MNDNGKRAVLYARCSGDDRDTDGRNLASQLEMCRQWAAERGYSVVAEIAEEDNGASGTSFDLNGLNRILVMAEHDEFDVLIPREIDRLSRNLAKQLIVEELLRRNGVVIDYVLGDYPDTPEGQLNKHIRTTIAEFEREKITERSIRARRNAVRDGSVLVCARPPYGYRSVKDKGRYWLVVDETEAAVVRIIFEWYTKGDGENGPLSIYAIKRKLEGMPSPADVHGMWKQRERGKWNKSVIGYMLANETYAGVWRYGKTHRVNGKSVRNPDSQVLTVQVPAIVDRETWEAAQARRAAAANSRHNAKYEHLLARRVTCGNCGSKMRWQTSRGRYHYVRCPATDENADRVRSCDLPFFRGDRVDELAWGWIRELLSSPEALERGLRKHTTERDRKNAPILARLAVIDDLLTDNRKQLERLLVLFLAAEIPCDMLTDRKARLETIIDALDKERAELAVQLEATELTEKQIATLTGYVQNSVSGHEVADADFAARLELVQALDVQATFYVEDGQRMVHLSCLWEKKISQL